MELVERVVEGFRKNGHDPYWVNWVHERKGDEQLPEITIHVRETNRQNHINLENVTVTIEVTKWGGNTGTRLAKLHVPKDASDRVIEKRVGKALDYLN